MQETKNTENDIFAVQKKLIIVLKCFFESLMAQ